jgi:hypothetical protein
MAEPYYNPPLTGQNGLLGGVTLRDEFAGRVVAGMMTRMEDEVIQDIANGTRAGGPIARVAYTIADAMLRERAVQR